jgi:hypothetical protein
MKELTIRTDMWEDPWFFELNANEKLVWVYLISNSVINIGGILRASIPSLSLYCSLPDEEIRSIMQRFVDDGKILYEDNFVFVVNFRKYHVYGNSLESGASKAIMSLPEHLRGQVIEILEGLETLPTPSQEGLETLSNKNKSSNKNNINNNILNIKSNSDSKPDKIDWELIKDKWNEISEIAKPIPSINMITDSRKTKVKLRLKAGFDLIEKFDAVYDKIDISDFLKGEKKGWKVTFDWLFANDVNWAKVLEGNYDNKEMF